MSIYDDPTTGQILGLMLACFVAMFLLGGAIYGIGWGLYLLWNDVICESLLVCR